MHAELQVREAVADDMRTLVDLNVAAGLDDAPSSLSDTALRGLWARMRAAVPGAQVYLFSRGGRALGTYTLFILPLLAHDGAPEAIVEDVAVHPEAQGQGIGQQMMAHARARAHEAGCYKLALSSNRKREAAHAFYQSLGFTQHGYSFVVTP